jgi:hypothetical protein
MITTQVDIMYKFDQLPNKCNIDDQYARNAHLISARKLNSISIHNIVDKIAYLHTNKFK